MHQLHIIADKQVLIINITRNDVNRYISKLRFFLNDLYIHVIVGILVQFIGKKIQKYQNTCLPLFFYLCIVVVGRPL